MRDPLLREPSPPFLGIVGYGAIADYHVRAIHGLARSITHVTGRDQVATRSFAREHGIAHSDSDMDSMLADPDVGSVVVASPSAFHATHARKALGAGKHVLCEIPLAMSGHDAEDVTRLAADRGLVLAVCHTLRYFPTVQTAHAALSGMRVRHVVARNLSFRRENVGWTGRRRTWTDDLLWHDGAHVVDATLGFLGASITRVAAVACPATAVGDAPTDYEIVLGADDGGIASISLSYDSRASAGDYVVIADDLTLVIDGLTVHADGQLIYAADPAKDILATAVREQDADFLSAVASGTAPASSAEAIMPSMSVLQRVADVARMQAVLGIA